MSLSCFHVSVVFFVRMLIALAIGVMVGGDALAQLREQVPGDSRPNVLFIVVDDLNDVPTFMGRYPDAITPNMDRLAERGVTFLNAHTAVPVCNPSRACFMSGLRLTSFDASGGTGDATKVEGKVQEVGGVMMDRYYKEQGYKVFSIGKIYHNGRNTTAPDVIGGNHRFGRDQAINFDSDDTLTDWGIPSYADRIDRFSDYDNAEFAIELLEKDHDAPFLMMLGFVQPHVPWYTPQSYLDLYPESVTLAPFDPTDMDDISAEAVERNIRAYMPHTDDMIELDQRQAIMRHYLACVSFTDHYIGEVLDALDASPYADNTVIVLFSDHGYHLGEKNTYQKQTLWERSSHVPLVVAGPGIEPGGRSSRVVSLLDVYPTLLDLCGLPENPVTEGDTLRPLLDNPQAQWDRPAVIKWGGNNYAVQTERYRYIYYSQGNEELYDHAVDLAEIHNLAGNPEYDEIKASLKNHLPLNLTSPGFPVITHADGHDPEAYLDRLLKSGDVKMYGTPITDLNTVVQGMKLTTSIHDDYFHIRMIPANAAGERRAREFSIRQLRDLDVSGIDGGR